MTTILPGARTSWDVIGQALGTSIGQNLPGAIQQGYQRQIGMNAINQAEKDIEMAGGDPYKIALAFAKAGAQNPSIERALGPLMQTALTNSKINRAFPQETSGSIPKGSEIQPMARNQLAPQISSQSEEAAPISIPKISESTFASPGPFNVFTPDQINSESERYAKALQDPSAYQVRQSQLQNSNIVATQQREALENAALKTGSVTADDLPRYMQIGSKFDPSNPSEWVQKTNKEYQKIRGNDKKLANAFIPGLGSALFGANRDQALKRLIPTVQDYVQKGLEQEARNFLADNYVSPTEIESLIHPLSKEQEKAISSLPRGFFPNQSKKKADEKMRSSQLGQLVHEDKSPFISYDEALVTSPKELEKMQNILSDFFLKNVNKNTSLLGLRQKIWEDRDYDWRQIGPAIRQAEKMGLKLEPFQSTELTEIETQPPYESLPHIFMDLDRFIKYHRGNK